MRSSAFLILSSFVACIAAFDNTRYDNLAVYWGQNSHGASDSGDTANYQKPISFYCQDDSINVLPVAFLNKFSSTGGVPEINLANICNNKDNPTFPGTALADCSAVSSDFKTCQSKGKILTLSLGGAGGGVSFNGNSDAEALADFVWNSFLGGSSTTRPFGDVVLDGVDLDIESGGSTGYIAFVNRIRSYTDKASKKYYITAAPQCVFPDASLGDVINGASFDAIYVQFYNNQCGLNNFNIVSDWNFGIWDHWATTVSPNKNVKIYLGAPASTGAAGSGYTDATTLGKYAKQMRTNFPSFGGIMLWDASQAYANNRFDKAIKAQLVANGGTGFTYPACSAPAYVSGSVYTANNQVSYQGYIYTAKWWTQSTPSVSTYGDWTITSACKSSKSPASNKGSKNASVRENYERATEEEKRVYSRMFKGFKGPKGTN